MNPIYIRNLNSFFDIVPKDVVEIARIFKKESYEIFLVGGCVRDIFMDIEPHDWDMCTNATPNQMIDICNKYQLHYIETGLQHGTLTIHLNGENYEVTTYRIDGKYSDGRHPDSVSFTTSLEEDLARRDFTINAMAIDPITATIFDPYGGSVHIMNKKLIAVGKPDERLEEDGLRILRALRFAIKYDLSIDSSLALAIKNHNYMLSLEKGLISRERVTEEFRKMFTCNMPVIYVFSAFRDTVATIIPEIEKTFDFNQNNKYHTHDVYTHILHVVDNCKTTKFEIKMAALLHDIAKPDSYVEDEEGFGHFYGHPKMSADICAPMLKKQFKLSTIEYDRIMELVEFHDMDIAETTKSVRRALNKHGKEYMEDWLILKQADMDDHNYFDDKHMRTVSGIKTIMENIIESNMAFSLKDLDINGNDLMRELQLKPSPTIGQILGILLQKVIDDELENRYDALLFEARQINNSSSCQDGFWINKDLYQSDSR